MDVPPSSTLQHNILSCCHDLASAGHPGYLKKPANLLTCMKYLLCGVIYFLYLVHISYNPFPNCCQRCTTQIVPTMCYYTQNNYFLCIYWVSQLYLYHTILYTKDYLSTKFLSHTLLIYFSINFPTPIARKISYTEIKLKKSLGISDFAKVKKCGKGCKPHTGTATLILSCLI